MNGGEGANERRIRGWQKRLQKHIERVQQETDVSVRLLSARAGLSHNVIYGILNINRDPQLMTIMRLADVLGLPYETVLTGQSTIVIGEQSARPTTVRMIALTELSEVGKPLRANTNIDLVPVRAEDYDEHTGAVILRDDSMATLLNKNDIAFYAKTSEAKPGDVVVVEFKNETIVRHYHPKFDNRGTLKSAEFSPENPRWPNRVADEGEKVIIRGVVSGYSRQM